ncbi:sulfite exporter TauE/SafE family protein [Pseudooctadecabacter sp.]|uniref:sulfite exporter TauE/SafE family protein n=1 Tax=Pseudooctadecabacter sp. TaxID=1966338 RepID=UPI0025E5688E|nr:sulfite exporter TauE/SafE family protein [Pseudooctadecabacter sp.]
MRYRRGSGTPRYMDFGTLADLSGMVITASLLIGFLAGIVKGAIGFALPLIMISGLSSIMDPRLALAGLIVPVVVTNLWQIFRDGIAPVLAAVRDVWRYVVIVCLSILVFAQLVPMIPQRVFYFLLGVPVVMLAVVQLAGVRLTIPPHRRGPAEVIAAAISGMLGGLAGTWGPTTVLYLLAIETPKAKQMVVQGVIYGSGAFMLLFAHLYSGILTPATTTFSAVLLLPALLGMWIGFRLQDRMNQDSFRRATLVMLVIGGLNLLRKGLFG